MNLRRLPFLGAALLAGASLLPAQSGPPSAFPDGAVGVPYFFDIGAALGIDFSVLDQIEGVDFRFGFTLGSGSPLPLGLSLKPNGQISGTPTTPGDYGFMLLLEFHLSVPGFPFDFSVPFPGMIRVTGTAVSQVSVAPSGISVALAQGAAPASRGITVSNRGSVPQSFTAAASVSSGQGWLSVSPGGGTVGPFGSASIDVTVDAGRLATGTYSGSVTVSVSPSGQSVTVPVVVTVSAGGQAIQISQTGLRFLAVQGAATPVPQTIRVLGSGSGNLNFSVLAATQSGGSGWLAATPGGGSVPEGSSAAVSVSVNPAGLQPGTYYGTVAFSAPQVDNSPQVATVVLTVFPSTTLLDAQVTPSGLIFVGRVSGGNPAAKTVTVRNLANSPLSLKTAKFFDNGSNWFSVQPQSATVVTGQPVSLTVQIDSTGLAAGVYSGDLALTFVESGSVQHVTVLLVMIPAAASANQAPARAAAGCTPTKLLPVFTLLGAGFSNPAGWPSSLGVTVVDDCGEPMRTGSVQTAFSNGDAPLPLLPLGDGTWSATWRPQKVTTQVTITASAQQTTPPLSGTARIGGQTQDNPSVPIVSSGGVVSAAASFAANRPLAPGAFVSIFGLSLGNGLSIADTLPYPTRVGSTQVVLGGRELPLYFSVDNQVNAVIPYDAPLNTTQQLVVINGDALSTPEPVVIAAAQPAIYTYNQQGTGAAIVAAVTPDRVQFLVDAQHPAHAGDALIIYCTGLGAVDPPVPAGSAGPLAPLSQTTNPVTVTLGGVTANVFFAGLAPGYPALYQVNAFVPEGVSGSDVPLTITVAGQESPTVTVPVQ